MGSRVGLSIRKSKELNFLNIFLPVCFVEGERFLLGWALNIGFVFQQFLNAKQNLFDGNVWLPIFLVVENGETDSPGRVDIGMG